MFKGLEVVIRNKIQYIPQKKCTSLQNLSECSCTTKQYPIKRKYLPSTLYLEKSRFEERTYCFFFWSIQLDRKNLPNRHTCSGGA